MENRLRMWKKSGGGSVTPDEKRKGYRKVAIDLIDYLYLCNERNIVPLRHDVNVFNARFTAIDKAKGTK